MPRARTVLIILSTATLIPLIYTLAHVSINRAPTPQAGQSNLAQLAPLWITSALTIAALTALWFNLRTSAPEPGPQSANVRVSPHDHRRAALLVLSIAAAARLAVLLTHSPSLSDDIHRYTFDGNNLANLHNPYTIIPNDRLREIKTRAQPRFSAEPQTIAAMNNRELPTIYLPVSQYIFAAVALLTPDTLPTPDTHARIMRAVFIFMDLILIALLLYALHRRGTSPWYAALYAFHPLPIIEIAGSGHQDILGITLFITALLLYQNAPDKTIRWTIPLALAALVKPFVILIAPALLLRANREAASADSAKKTLTASTITSLITGALICCLLSAPLLLTQNARPLQQLTSTAQRFSLKWANFSSIYQPTLYSIEQLTNDPDQYWQTPVPDRMNSNLWSNDHQEQLARIICGLLAALIIIAIILATRRFSALHAAAAILLTMILFSPTVHPWYALWPFAIFPLIAPPRSAAPRPHVAKCAPHPRISAMSLPIFIAAATLPLAYYQFADVTTWQTPTWVHIIAYTPIYLALLINPVHNSTRRRV